MTTTLQIEFAASIDITLNILAMLLVRKLLGGKSSQRRQNKKDLKQQLPTTTLLLAKVCSLHRLVAAFKSLLEKAMIMAGQASETLKLTGLM